MIIRCCDKPELMKPGLKIQVMTNADHQAINIGSKTASWGTSAEFKYCNKTLILTQSVIDEILKENTVRMSNFPEFRTDGWVMHYADFKFETIYKKSEVNLYQCLQINTENNNVKHIAISKNEKQINELKVLNEKNNENENIIYKIITFSLTETKEVTVE